MKLSILHISRSLAIALISLFLLLVIEIRFDVIEVAIGKYMLITNPIRPKVGRLWVEEEKDVTGQINVSSLASEQKADSTFVQNISQFDQLQQLLNTRRIAVISRDDFLSIYRSMSSERARVIIAPLTLYDLSRDKSWINVKFVLDNDQLSVYFLDGFEQVLYENYIDINQLSVQLSSSGLSLLDEDERFRGRIIPADLFYRAFDKLPNVYRLQIINDPKKLIDWQGGLRRVAISQYTMNGTVTIAFEVLLNNRLQIFERQASEMAASYLISAINSLGEMTPLQLPQPKVDR